MYCLRLTILALFIFPPIVGQILTPPAGTGSISGKITEPNGQPVEGMVTATSGAFVQRALAKKDGLFTLRNLPAGTFTLCAQVPSMHYAPTDDPFVDNCQWVDASNPRVTLTAGQTRQNANIPLQRGRRVQVRVDDPNNILGHVQGKVAQDVTLRVTGPSGLTYHVPIVKLEAGRRFHEIVIPYSAEHQLAIASDTYKLTDNNGKDISNAGPQTVKVTPGDPPTSSIVKVDSKGGK